MLLGLLLIIGVSFLSGATVDLIYFLSFKSTENYLEGVDVGSEITRKQMPNSATATLSPPVGDVTVPINPNCPRMFNLKSTTNMMQQQTQIDQLTSVNVTPKAVTEIPSLMNGKFSRYISTLLFLQ